MKHLLLFESFDKNEVLYHGTKNKFTRFEIGRSVSNPTYGGVSDNGLGIFFTDNQTMAKWFAGMIDYDVDTERYEDTGENGHIISAKVNLKNPWVLSEHVDDIDEDDPGQTYFDVVDEMGGGEQMRKKLESEGYDGVVVNDMRTNYYEDGAYKMVVAFNSDSIRVVR